jgi:HEPN domain-containing protein
MTKSTELKQWFDIAESDLQLAEDTTTKTYPVVRELVCYHCQQSAEKYLKGYLRFADIHFDKIHDLRMLLKQCIDKTSSFVNILPQCNTLTKYENTPRYPQELLITESEMQYALQCAKVVQDFVRKKLTKAGYTPETGGTKVVAAIETKP